MSKSKQKPAKPRTDFPLFAHGNGQWAKKIKGKLVYFGSWDDPAAAESQYLDEREYWQAGRQPPKRKDPDAIDVADLCNLFLETKERKRQNGEITQTTFQDYLRTCRRVIGQFGRNRSVADLQPADFAGLRDTLNGSLGLVAQKNEINRVRIVFKYGYDQGELDRPVRFGEDFAKPSAKVLKQARQQKQRENGKRMFSAEELQLLLHEASDPLRAFILLGINCGFGASDISSLPRNVVSGEWLEYPRAKNGNERLIHLWPETREAIEAAPRTGQDPTLLFVTRTGKRYVRMSATGSRNDGIGAAMSKLLKCTGLKRPGLNHYALRHTFETIAGATTDQQAVDAIMGHSGHEMANTYTEEIGQDRLKSVTDHVHGWLFGGVR